MIDMKCKLAKVSQYLLWKNSEVYIANWKLEKRINRKNERDYCMIAKRTDGKQIYAVKMGTCDDDAVVNNIKIKTF